MATFYESMSAHCAQNANNEYLQRRSQSQANLKLIAINFYYSPRRVSVNAAFSGAESTGVVDVINPHNLHSSQSQANPKLLES